MPLSVLAQIFLTEIGYAGARLPSPVELCLPETQTTAEKRTQRHKTSAIPPLYLTVEKRCTAKSEESDTLLSLTPSNVFADQPGSHAPLVTAQV